MATYINYGEGEEDAVVQAAEWLRGRVAEQLGEQAETTFIEEFKEIQNQNPDRFDYFPVFKLFAKHASEVFSCISEGRAEERTKEAESFFAVVFSLLVLFDEPEHVETATKDLCKLLSSATTHGELRLRLLMMLYNTYDLPTFELRYKVFKHVLDYSAKAGLFDQIIPYLDYLDAWMADWEKYMTVDDKRDLYRDLSKYMRDWRKRSESFLYLKKYALLYQGESAKALSADPVVEMTVQLLTEAIKLPSVVQFDDLLSYDTVKALAKSKQGSLVKLCEVFLSGTVKDFRDFHDKNKKLFEEHDISFQDALGKIRLLAIATLAHGRQELTLPEIAKTLEEQEDNVEPWVVRAISDGLIDGRIDQLERKLLVKSGFQRKFEKEEWAFLDSKLSCWISNLENVIKFVGDQAAAKAVAAPAA